MKTKRILSLTAIFAAATLLTGCASIERSTRVKPAPLSPFLEHKELLRLQDGTFPFHYFYVKKDAGVYQNIYIKPVNIKYLKENKNWAKLDEKLARQIGSDIDKLAVFMQDTYKEEFRKNNGKNHLLVVDSPDQKEKTLIAETAIIAIVPTTAELTILGTAANLLLPGIGILTGHVAAGSITIECMIRDAQTNEIIAMYANTEADQHAVLNIAGMSWYTSAKNNIRKEADFTARIFSGRDYTKARRKLIKIIQL